jgi:hypothetical protein
MPFCDHVTINDNQVKICDNAMECVCCSYFLERLNIQVVDDILATISKLPKEVTSIKTTVFPTPNNIPFYSFYGIEYIVSTLFKNYKWGKSKKSWVNKHYLKLYFEKSSLFTLPILQIEIILLGNIPQANAFNFLEILKFDILNLVGTVGNLDIVKIRDKSHLSELLKTPLLFGYPEFKVSGILLEHGFTEEQVLELNYLHTYTLQPLDYDASNNQMPLLFLKDQRRVIQEKLQKQQADDEKIINDVINALFEEDDR